MRRKILQLSSYVKLLFLIIPKHLCGLLPSSSVETFTKKLVFCVSITSETVDHKHLRNENYEWTKFVCFSGTELFDTEIVALWCEEDLFRQMTVVSFWFYCHFFSFTNTLWSFWLTYDDSQYSTYKLNIKLTDYNDWNFEPALRYMNASAEYDQVDSRWRI